MKVLAVGDIHGDKSLAKELAERADQENVDFVVMCGDISNSDENFEGIVGLFKQKVLMVPGNHDSDATVDFLAELYKARNLEGYGYNLGEVGFFGCGSVVQGVFQKHEREILEMLKRGASYVKDCKKKVLVSHTHPVGTKMERFSDFVHGSESLRTAIDELKPDFVFCSHVHEAEGIEEMIGDTRVINVGRKGKILEI
jgi:hypothetical protein